MNAKGVLGQHGRTRLGGARWGRERWGSVQERRCGRSWTGIGEEGRNRSACSGGR